MLAQADTIRALEKERASLVNMLGQLLHVDALAGGEGEEGGGQCLN